ncbi:MAG TPA: dephospho-CoA kinase [Polyangiales bacterium]
MTAPVVVGLTGGIAAGKSTVARQFTALGVPVVDADKLAREAVAPGSEGLAEIVALFGPEVLLRDGTLDRKAVGARVFADANLRAKLNAITHPKIGQLGAQRVAEHAARGAHYVVYEAPLIVENNLHRAMHRLVVVSVDPVVQLARLIRRDGLTESEARARIDAQMPLEKKLEVADFVIDNSGEPEAVHDRVHEVHGLLLAQLGITAP